MRKLAVWVVPHLRDDRAFSTRAEDNIDNCLASGLALRDVMISSGWECHTFDYYKKRNERPDSILFTEMPRLPLPMVLGSGGFAGLSSYRICICITC